MVRFIRYSVVGLVLALSLTITGVTYADDAWVITEIGYKIWNPCSAPNENVSWSGGADDKNYATGKGTIKWVEDGQLIMTYDGDVVKGKANGKGVMTWPDGDRYEGDFVNGERKGYGTFYRCDGTTQQGQWDNDEFVG